MKDFSEEECERERWKEDLGVVIDGPKCPNVGSRKPPRIFEQGNDIAVICALELYTRHSFLGKEGGRICETLLLLPRFPVEDTVIILFFRVLLSPHTSTTLTFLPTMQLTDAQHLKVNWGWMTLQPPLRPALRLGKRYQPCVQQDSHGVRVCSDGKYESKRFIKVKGCDDSHWACLSSERRAIK